MRGLLVACALFASACVSTASDECGDGKFCREGTQCHAISETTTECVLADQLAACDGESDRMACTATGIAGTCYGGACLPAGCGNLRLDAAEVCDDGNVSIGDGCSPDCLSAETCGNGRVDPVTYDEMSMALVGAEQCDDANTLSHDGCASTCLPEVLGWQPVGTLPPARVFPATATDFVSRSVVMFGGLESKQFSLDGAMASAGKTFGDTWLLSTNGWTPLSQVVAPSPRWGHAMAFDGTRTILFGGMAGQKASAETWEFVDNSWRALANGPARRGHAMAYLPGTGLVLFGGRGEANMSGTPELSETWLFANDVWTQLTPLRVPSARMGHVMVYDPERRVIVMTGGTVGDTWEFSGTDWTEVASEPNSPTTMYSAAAYDHVRHRVVVTGGFVPNQLVTTTTPSNTTWEWDGTTWMNVSPAAEPSVGAAGATDPATGQPVVFGGALYVTSPTEKFQMNDHVTRRDALGWTPAGYVVPAARMFAASTVDLDRRCAVVFGGSAAPEKLTLPALDGETLELVGETWRSVATTGPSPRRSAAMAYATFGALRGSYLFGGMTDLSSRATSFETWRWDGTAWAKLPLTAMQSPGKRAGHAMVFDPVRGTIVMFGGESVANLTWTFDGTSWTMGAAGPPARSEHVMAWDPVRKVVVLWGGVAAGIELADTWIWDGATWTELHPTLSPPPRLSATLAWDAARGKLVLFGGGALASNESWEWDGTTWTFISTFDTPDGRAGQMMTSDPSGAGVVIYGGIDGVTHRADSARLSATATTPTTYARCVDQSDDDGDGAIGCADRDCWARCTPWCPPGTGTCDVARPTCGDGTCDAVESCGICPEDCTCAAVCGDFTCEAGEAASCPGDCP